MINISTKLSTLYCIVHLEFSNFHGLLQYAILSSVCVCVHEFSLKLPTSPSSSIVGIFKTSNHLPVQPVMLL